jgi:hypothetical protein
LPKIGIQFATPTYPIAMPLSAVPGAPATIASAAPAAAPPAAAPAPVEAVKAAE